MCLVILVVGVALVAGSIGVEVGWLVVVSVELELATDEAGVEVV
jgi:hypothetical protein